MAIWMYPDDCIQYLVDPWWEQDADPKVVRGRLMWAYVPHVHQQPYILRAEGRRHPRDHTAANYKVEPLRLGGSPPAPVLPVAGMPTIEGEVRTVHRAKTRPVIVVSTGGSPVDKTLRTGGAGWQTTPTILVVPSYGVTPDGTRGGWKQDLVTRIRRCEYPQYLWDKLPLGRGESESVLRFDHIQPIGAHGSSYEITPHRLSSDALSVLDEWLDWMFRGVLDENSVLFAARETLLELEG